MKLGKMWTFHHGKMFACRKETSTTIIWQFFVIKFACLKEKRITKQLDFFLSHGEW